MKDDESIVVDGYDLLAETARSVFSERTLCGRTLDRTRARLSPEGLQHPDRDDVRRAHHSAMMPTTLGPESSVIDLSYPTSGMFVDSPAGLYLDLSLGLAQKVIDDQHPQIRRCVATLAEHGLAFRRDVNSDDYLCFSRPIDGLHTPQELAGLINRLTAERLEGLQGCRTFFSNSGAEAGEVGLELAQLYAYRCFVQRHGPQLLERLMADLGIARNEASDSGSDNGEPLYRDYPFFVVGCEQACHGRTLGVLNLTRSKREQLLGFRSWRWVRHVPFNGSVEDYEELFDDRPIGELLELPGGVRGVIDRGSIPADLLAAFVVEVCQGEGGYRLADRSWFVAMAAATRRRAGLVCVDEVQSFGRTGRLYAVEHMGVSPDILWTAKAAVLGVTVARREVVWATRHGWHANTFSSGKLFDVNMAWVTWWLLTEHAEPAFEGRTLLENSRLKGEYLRMRLAELSAAHAEVLVGFSGLGGMWGLSVRHRQEVIATGWRLGLKLIGCGEPGETARLRLVLLADVLTHEIDELVAGLGRVLAEVEARHLAEE